VGPERLERMASLGRAFEDVMAAWSWAAGWAAGPVSASASASAVGLAAASQPVQAPTAGAPRWPAAELARLSRPLIVLCDAHGRSSEGAALVGGAAEAVSRASNADADALGTLLVQQAWLQCKVGQFGGARVNARRGLEL